ncbi:Trimethylguanosine synthase [Bonamia ostreae]|uniref:Trimethylguanosine synthase n=1 Tax=Bonamia ostreae TaxID=126728 RepID=A0ABV2AN63_9EUKA
MDYVSWYSVTPEFVAKRIAARMACNIVVDGFCGAGGNSIQFASTCDAVYAIDNNENRLRCAKNNAAVYGASNIEFILGDVFAIVPLLIADCVFMSPPWGGPEYSKKLTFDFSDLDSLSGYIPFDIFSFTDFCFEFGLFAKSKNLFAKDVS